METGLAAGFAGWPKVGAALIRSTAEKRFRIAMRYYDPGEFRASTDESGLGAGALAG